MGISGRYKLEKKRKQVQRAESEKIKDVVLGQIEAEKKRRLAEEVPQVPSTMMSAARLERQYFNQLNNAVDSAELTPLQQSFLIGATNRIQPHLRQGEEFQKILKEALKEAEEVYNHAMRKWRMQQTVIDPVRGRIKKKVRKPFPGLTIRMGEKEFQSTRKKLEKNLHTSNTYLQQMLTLCYNQFSSKQLIDLVALTRGKSLQISNLLGSVKFQIKQEEEMLKNGFFSKIISLFGSGVAGSLFETSPSFRSCLKCILEQQLQFQILDG